LVVCISHLNIIDAIGHFSAKYKVADCEKAKQELPEENEAKEKTGGEEKFCAKNYLSMAGLSGLLNLKKPICYHTMLQQQFWHDKDIRPPRLV
jgi:hypothetical protein